MSDLSSIARQIRNILVQQAQHASVLGVNQGMHKHAIAGRLSTPTPQIAAALDELLKHGYVYTIGEEDRYAASDT